MEKTTVGRRLAQKLNWEFVDLEVWLEARLIYQRFADWLSQQISLLLGEIVREQLNRLP